jgi:malyl-CoA/(S)-citramalyl-CoA lyase
MSLTQTPERTTRVNRSELSVPASNPRFIDAASRSDADIIFLDLEDAVAPDEKEQARKHAIEALQDIDWSGRTVSIRINGLDTQYMYRDVVDVVERAGDRLDLIMIPKVGTAADVYAVDALVTGIESAMGFRRRIGFELLIETALGMQNIDEIAAASPRIESLHFGVADYAASTQARTMSIGGANPDYQVLTDPDGEGRRVAHWGDMWHFALSRLVVAARANGLRPVDGPFGDISDREGFEAQARRSAALGFEGKWAIHPSQIELANRVFCPSDAEVGRARGILQAMEDAERDGRGAVAYEGKMIDIASLRQAALVVRKAEEIGAKTGSVARSA